MGRVLALLLICVAAACSPQDAGGARSRPDPAIATRPASLPADPPSVDRAAKLILEQQYAQALAELEPVLAQRPDSIRVHEYRAIALMELHRYEEAGAAFDKLIAIEPRVPAHRIGRARSFEMLGNLDGASAAAAAALDLDPNHPEALLAAAQIAMRRRDDAKARAHFTHLLEVSPWGNSSAAAHYALSQIAARAGDRKEADLQKQLYTKKFDWAERRTALERKIAIQQNDPNVYRKLASLYREAGDGQSAVRILETVVRASPRDPVLKVEFAQSRELAGDAVGAWNLVAEALALDGNCLSALCYKIHLQIQRGDWGGAAATLEKAVDLDPSATHEPRLRTVADELIEKARTAGQTAAVDRAESSRKILGR